MGGLSEIQIDATDVVNPTVKVGGQDVTEHVKAVHLTLRPGQELPQVVFELAPGAHMAFEGMAVTAVGERPDPGPAAATFLAAIDAVQLEQAALNREDLGNEPGDLTRGMLRQLTEWALGGGS